MTENIAWPCFLNQNVIEFSPFMWRHADHKDGNFSYIPSTHDTRDLFTNIFKLLLVLLL